MTPKDEVAPVLLKILTAGGHLNSRYVCVMGVALIESIHQPYMFITGAVKFTKKLKTRVNQYNVRPV